MPKRFCTSEQLTKCCDVYGGGNVCTFTGIPNEQAFCSNEASNDQAITQQLLGYCAFVRFFCHCARIVASLLYFVGTGITMCVCVFEYVGVYQAENFRKCHFPQQHVHSKIIYEYHTASSVHLCNLFAPFFHHKTIETNEKSGRRRMGNKRKKKYFTTCHMKIHLCPQMIGL